MINALWLAFWLILCGTLQVLIPAWRHCGHPAFPFLLGAVLGMSYTDLIMDFEFTSFAYNYRPHDEVDPKGIYNFPSLITAMRDSAYYEEGKKISAIVEDWMIGELDMTKQEVEALREALLE